MVSVKPDRPRAVTESIPGGIRVSVRSQRSWYALLFLPVWLVGWAFGEVSAIATMAGAGGFHRSPHPTPTGFLAIWLVAWTLAGGLVLATFLWMAFGRESVEVSGGSLRVRREALGIGRTSSYALARVLNIRWSPAPVTPFSFDASRRYWGIGNGVIGFDYGAKTVRVLPGVGEAEANRIVEALRARVGSGAAP